MMKSNQPTRNYVFGVIFALLVVVFLILLDVHGFANHIKDEWP